MRYWNHTMRAGITQCATGITQCVTGITQWATGITKCVTGITQCVTGITQCVTGITQCVTGITIILCDDVTQIHLVDWWFSFLNKANVYDTSEIMLLDLIRYQSRDVSLIA
jgi:hypothetical protein